MATSVLSHRHVHSGSCIYLVAMSTPVHTFIIFEAFRYMSLLCLTLVLHHQQNTNTAINLVLVSFTLSPSYILLHYSHVQCRGDGDALLNVRV